MPLAVVGRFALTLVVCVGIIAQTQAKELKGAAADAAVQRAVEKMSEVRTLVAGFDMLTPTGINRGQIFIDRTRELMRMQFQPPLNHLLLVNGPITKFFGGNGTQIETATAGTPLGFLMNPAKALRTKVDVLQVDQSGNDLFIALAEKDKLDAGQIILHFKTGGDWELLDWGLRDKEGRFTQTKLRQIETGVRLDDDLFVAPE
ncbi:MAG: LolA family protein [Alphaproteobacteria bacterium]|jgi:outer membrane lipoprotein-sorting protein